MRICSPEFQLPSNHYKLPDLSNTMKEVDSNDEIMKDVYCRRPGGLQHWVFRKGEGTSYAECRHKQIRVTEYWKVMVVVCSEEKGERKNPQKSLLWQTFMGLRHWPKPTHKRWFCLIIYWEKAVFIAEGSIWQPNYRLISDISTVVVQRHQSRSVLMPFSRTRAIITSFLS